MTLITLKGGAQVSMRPQDISIELQKFEELKTVVRKARKIISKTDLNNINSFDELVMLLLNDEIKLMVGE
jgi:hypothetical protein